MEEKNIIYDCSRGCNKERTPQGELLCEYDISCCKRGVFNWLEAVSKNTNKDIYEVRFKNTRKIFFENSSNQLLKIGDIVVVEANTGHDIGIITLSGPIVALQMKRNRINLSTYEFKKIYRKAKSLDIERWQEAIAREHETMIRSRQISAEMKLDMKIGDVEFQGDGTKAIFYYIADERVDFRQLIKVFADEFRIRIEMRQIGARQEAALIGGLGVCGRALCCSNYITNFHSITTQAARCQDLSLNPQKLAGQCGKLKCCINYEAPVYMDSQNKLPRVNGPLQLMDGEAFLIKTDILKRTLWFSYDPHSMANMIPLSAEETLNIIKLNNKGIKPKTLLVENEKNNSEFVTSVGDDNIDRFDKSKKRNNRKKRVKKDKITNDKQD
jgi:cell fate regulator YaaT (PSP1 superfamily)